MIATDQAHNNLKNLLFNGRILINGLPLTVNEVSVLIQGEQMLFEKASKLDAAAAHVAKQQGAKQKGKTVKLPKPLNLPENAGKKKD